MKSWVAPEKDSQNSGSVSLGIFCERRREQDPECKLRFHLINLNKSDPNP